MEWYQKNREQLMDELNTDFNTGLSNQEAEKKLQEFGFNRLDEQQRKSMLSKLLEQLLDPMVIILIVAAVLSAITGDIIEMVVILAIVVVNSLMSIYQEGKAEDSIEALQKMSSPTATVIRDGIAMDIKSAEIVPGDIISLETGDIVPADMRLLETSNMQIDESALTGESVAVEKYGDIVYKEGELREIGDRENTAFSSTIVTYGRGKGVVVATAHDTEIGKIATSISSYDDEQTPLQKRLASLSKLLGILVLGICVVVFTLGWIRGYDHLGIFKTAISLAVAAIPEGMTAVVTIVLSIGMNNMAKRNAIVKKLLSVETLGTTTVICSDKTGTLTQNEMTVTKAYTGGNEYDITGVGYGPEGAFSKKNGNNDEDKQIKFMLTLASLANDAKINEDKGNYVCIGDPTEGALLTASSKLGLSKEKLNEKYPRIEELPFDSSRKMMSTFHEGLIDGKIVTATKGAPDIIIDKCSKVLINGEVKDFTPELKKEALDKNSEFAKHALRVLSFAYNVFDKLPESSERNSENIENNMIFVGLTGMIDPPRPEVKDAIAQCNSAGIQVKMITGDYLDTALAIATELGITTSDDSAIMGKDLNDLTFEQLQEVVREEKVFARVSPENKVQIVEALNANGHITAMTGDGVNDAPAIKKANIGISMGITGTDVAKNTAEVILTDDNFATIVHAVEEGRIIYSNIKKFVSFLLSCNIGEVLVIFVTILLGAPLPLTAIQLLWLNLVTDSLPALALGMEKGEPDIMENKPRNPNENIVDKKMGLNIVVQAIAITIGTLLAFFIGLKTQLFPEEIRLVGARTLAFATLITAELFRAYSVRSFDKSIAEIGLFSNSKLNKAILVSFALLVVVLYVPFLQEIFDVVSLGVIEWVIVFVMSVIPFASNELLKVVNEMNSKKSTVEN